MKADLHIHTSYSDGGKTVPEVLQLVSLAGLDYFCLTDHDTLKGSLEALNLVAGTKLNLIIGLELSTDLNGESIHLLGYFKETSKLEELDLILEEQRKQRVKRAYKIIAALKEHFQIDLGRDFVNSLHSITRGSIATEISKNYPYTRDEIFSEMLGEGRLAYFPSTKLKTKTGIKLIQEFGGLAVLAHPCLVKKNELKEIIQLGLDGIEAIYPLNQPFDETRFRDLANEYDLFITAGNDFHDFDDMKHGQIGELVLEGRDLEIFKNRLGVL